MTKLYKDEFTMIIENKLKEVNTSYSKADHELWRVIVILRELQCDVLGHETNSKSLGSENAWDRVWDKFKDHPELKRIQYKHQENGNSSCASMIIELIEKGLNSIESL